MMYLHSLVLFLLILPGGARRSIRIADFHHLAQKQNITLGNGLEVSADAREALIPRGFGKGVVRLAGPQTEASREGSKRSGRRAGHLESQRAAKDTLQATGGLDADKLPWKEDWGSATSATRIAPLAVAPTWSLPFARTGKPVASSDDDMLLLQLKLTSDAGITSFLLQRAVQTLCYSYRACRDPPSAKWLSDKSGVAETLHGIVGFPHEWRPWLLTMLESPPEALVVESVLKKNRGLSANNPYLQPTPMNYEYELRPADVAMRIMDTAVLLAAEWVEDLAKMQLENEATLRKRLAQMLDDTAGLREMYPVFTSEGGEFGADSPYRIGNYDLLLSRTTRDAVMAALVNLSVNNTASFKLLRDYTDANDGIFQGDAHGELQRDAAEKFLFGLLELPMSVRTGIGGGDDGDAADVRRQTEFVDPGAVCRLVLEYRVGIADAWIESLSRFGDELIEIQRELLERSFN